MKNMSLKTLFTIGLIAILTLFVLRSPIENLIKNTEKLDTHKYAIDFIDDSGHRIKMDKPATKIISLYSAHTENLFAIDAGKNILGIGRADAYPMEVFNLTRYDYRADPEKILAANPDLVLIRPFIERKTPDFVNSLRRSGINVVSLYPTKFSDFDDYILKLGMISGKEKYAQKKLNEFHEKIEEFKKFNSRFKDHPGVYFESSETGYTTVTSDSMPASAIKIAGGNFIANDAEPIEGSSIASYGIEKILQKANDIDIFISQRGVMGAGGNIHSITIRPGFKGIKAVKDNKVFEISQKIISSPTFRFLKGIHEVSRIIHPDYFDNLSNMISQNNTTNRDLAKLVVKYKHKVYFVPTSSYFRKEYNGHTYGKFDDLEFSDPDFDFIETAVSSGYMDTNKIDGIEYFYPEKEITKEEFAKSLYLISDLRKQTIHKEIKDSNDCKNLKIIQIIVDNNIMKLENGKFNPKDNISMKDAIQTLNKLKNTAKQ
ncbi:ABC transporter substrate-binding protein [Helicovermis profundi]|uniref:Fe/B12 periplasmic-binding domain-containing protein n=1 Tax=Helicovermis profundi TaxID=3065157 RepID=A0AAU9E300_9FIRM|nr:hypothetical protein HLPR_06210 [Clostridia bacterium S502]